MSPFLTDLLPPLMADIVHPFVDATTITLRDGDGAEFDPSDLDSSSGEVQECTVPCEAPWPYRAEGVGVESGMMQTSLSGRASGLTLVPQVGMLAELDGRTWIVKEAVHDLAAEDWILTLEGAG